MRGRSASLAALATAFLAAVAAAVLPSASSADPAAADRRTGALRSESASLARQSRSAVLGLYALETALADARRAQAQAERRVAELRRQRASVGMRVTIARRTLAHAQRRLALRLRALYEEGDVDPLAILLGADTIDEAIAGLDGLGFAARQDRDIVRTTTAARAKLVVLSQRLAARSAAAERAHGAAVSRAADLERTLAARRAYIERLARERRLRDAQIASLQRQARTAQVRSQAFVAAPEPAAPAAATSPAAAPAAEVSAAPTPAATAGRTLTVSATAYALPGRTASGLPVGWGVVAVDPSVIPLGTRMTIPGYGEGVAADVGPAVRGAEIDLWFPSVAQAITWGRRTVTITLH